jgi:molybdopterin molybdotransferase
MISVLQAREIVERETPRTGAVAKETVSLAEASGRVLASAVTAPFPHPRFTNSAMDGFAVCAADTAGATPEKPAVLRLAGVVPAGKAPDFALAPGECAQVMTGAPPPEGADAVVMVEETSGFAGDEVRVFRAARPGQNLRPQGSEVRRGETLLEPGLRIGPGELGVLAAFGCARVEVARRPRVSIFATGDELRQPGEPLADGEIYDSNLWTLAELARRAGAEVFHAGVLRDERDALRIFLQDALDRCDVVIASGGVSMGRYDLVRDAIEACGVEERFWQVAQKPGKPLFFGVRERAASAPPAGRSLFFGLPGNPVSSFMGFLQYAWPTLERMLGIEPDAALAARLAEPFPRERGKHRFLFGEAWVEDGVLRAAPTRKLGSNMLTSALLSPRTRANAVLEAAPGEEALAAGDLVALRLLPWTALRSRRGTA